MSKRERRREVEEALREFKNVKEAKVANINDLWDEYNLWLEAHGLHDEEEPPEDTFVGYDEDGEEIHVRTEVYYVWGVNEAFRLGREKP